MRSEKDFALEFTKEPPERTISFRMDPKIRFLYYELKDLRGVTNLTKLCKEALEDVILTAAKKAGVDLR